MFCIIITAWFAPSPCRSGRIRSVGGLSWERELEEIIVPETVQELEKEAFAGCRNLERLYIPASVTKIGMLLLRDSEQAVILCERDSCAHRYAETWGYPYELID